MLQAKLDILLRKQERINKEIEQVMNLIRQGGVDKCWNCCNTQKGTTDLNLCAVGNNNYPNVCDEIGEIK